MKKPSSILKKATASGGLLGALAIAGGTSAYGDILANASRLAPTQFKTALNARLTPPIVTGTPPDLTNTPGGANTMVSWDVNGDSIIDFTFINRYPNTTPGGPTNGVVWQMNMNPATGTAATNGVVSYQGAFIRYANALQPGAVVGPGGAFSTTTQLTLGSRYNYASVASYYGGFAAGGPNGSVMPGQFAYAGFRFQAADGTHYGYIQLSVSAGLIDFVSAAYNTTPNQAITIVPEPGTMAMMAIGAAALLGAAIKRRRG